MKRVIIESPFAGPNAAVIERNVRYVRACLKDSLWRGEAPLASHALYTLQGVLDDAVPEERRRGTEAGFAWGAVAELTAVYRDLGVTSGMIAGITKAVEAERMVDFRNLGGEWVRCLSGCDSFGVRHVHACPLWRAGGDAPRSGAL